MAEKGWKELPFRTLVIEVGNTVDYETGSWRALCPNIDLDKCTHCMFCWLFCPDASIIVKDSKVVGVDLEHCKGCGICAAECPRHVITMVEEAQAKKEDAS
ncbi:MAG: 4Fe-4S binding protein [Thermodesulfobacteriota bacterium]|nr:4Fe-4S binding protein [Thermodesulfobacteriota bacterium]